MTPLALLLALAGATTPAAPAIDPATRAAIEATCLDYVDGQLEGDPARVARSLHPDLAKRAILGDTRTSASACAGCRRKSWWSSPGRAR